MKADIKLNICIIIREVFDLILFIIKTTLVDEIAKNNNSNRCQPLYDRRGHHESGCSWRSYYLLGRLHEVFTNPFSGHGTYRIDNKIHASVLGTVEITNKLIIVNPLKSKYSPQVGDIVVGRVHEVRPNQFRLPTNDGK